LSLIEDMCDRLRIPAGHRKLAELVCKYHTHCHRAADLKISTILNVLEKLDVFRRPQRLHSFLLACEADARGRLGYEDSSYPQAEIFKHCFKVASDVDIKDLVRAGASGSEIQSQLRNRRIEAIASALKKE
jgi:tRNA nucleotidyltransferase (CCA-adding enzyme)